jgi:hypothetical protein
MCTIRFASFLLTSSHFLASVIGFCLFAMPAAAANPDTEREVKVACAASHLRAQQLRSEGDLLATRAELIACAHDQCPSLIRKECADWLDQVRSSIPTLVLIVNAEDGGKRLELEVTIGARKIANPLQPIQVNPGQHRVRVEAVGYRGVERQVVVSAAQQLKRVEVSLRLARTRADNATRTPWYHTDEVLVATAGVGLVGMAGLVWLGSTARSAERELGTCSPGCTEDEVDRVRWTYLWANVSLGVGALGLGAAGTLYLWRELTPNGTGSSARTLRVGLGGDRVTLNGQF